MKRAITINNEDNVAVALTNLAAGETLQINGNSIKLVTPVEQKHKFALKDFAIGDEVTMYGVTVGHVKVPVAIGEAVTTSNLKHKSGLYDINNRKKIDWKAPDISRWKDKTFLGYHRKDGQVGTANYWLVFPLVFCENRNVDVLKKSFEKGLGLEKGDKYEYLVKQLVSSYEDNEDLEVHDIIALEESEDKKQRVFENVDGIRFLTHQGGCGGTRHDSEVLCRLFAGYVNNPNVGGATVLSLGCQHAQVKDFQDMLQAINPHLDKPVIILDQQTVGTEKEMITRAIKETFLGMVQLNKLNRQPAPLSNLTIGLECGGSDGFSGISANPAIGYTSDLITALGGKAILSEFPELCGVEQELINRAVSDDVASKFASIMRAYEKAAAAVGSGFDMNPSPGNIRDGLITDAIKSAGAAKKGGTSPVQDVLDYTEYATKPGLSLLCTPGGDVESTTGLAGSGSNIILFTTGLGTPTGNPITPVIKLSSNTQLAERMPDIIDVDTGAIVRGEQSIEEKGEEILDFIIEVASGRKTTKAMDLDQNDFIPWKRGVSL
ncbi:MAG: altronate dehydratase family protein [Bacteroidetes bacterium]|nr:altronate dehydratase family protein [Bacteroidota bacterium]MDA1120505.1 altronate dehydratase family protein [Bacteroidota bacterium]